jgi:NAD+ diphosphatase
MGSDPFPFVPTTRFTEQAGPGIWFAFRERELLLTEGFALPRGPSLQPLGLGSVRVQLLGHLQGTPCYSAELPADAQPPAGGGFHNLRQLYGRLAEELMAIAARAVQTMEWDRTHQFCGACATPTLAHPTMRARVCPSCQLSYYPRLAPAIIVSVERGPEILLGRSPRFPPGIFSMLAGFVDPGESAEDAVHREVFEETAVRVKNVRYFGSQPWPFPHSLMLAFQAEHDSGSPVPDSEEIEEAAFFHVDALPPTFPGRVSISKWLLHDFCARHGRTVP